MHRRSVLRGLVWGGVALGSARIERLVAQGCESAPAGELLGAVPLHGDRPRATPFGELVGGPGLDARLFTDLSRLQPDRLITPTREVFVRTAAPAAAASGADGWRIDVRGFAAGDAVIGLDWLRKHARPMGAHLIECSGNADPDNFGLLSVAEWEGVPLAEVVSRLGRTRNRTAVLVSGMDDTHASRSSAPGASWIVPLDSLERLGACLAVGMNGAPLTPDHGAPVRLVIPGWYGCSWIKWVNELRLVGAEEPTTAQMMEFSLRTHQGAIPRLAHDYTPPVIDLAATPIRVEKRRINGRLVYRVVGIVWGGERPVDRLAIRFKAGDTPTPFALCPVPRTTAMWSLWDYLWQPAAPGLYSIALTTVDPSIRTRRLDVSYYVRRAIIDEV